jgi:polysaccharide export outer membrane protein
MIGPMLCARAPLLALAATVCLVGCSSARRGAAPAGDELAPRLSVSAIQPRGVEEPVRRPATSASATYSDIGAYRLRAGDPLVIFLRGIGPKDETIEDKIDENGNIDMPYIGSVRAAGGTQYQLEKTIQQLYMDRQIYRHISVSVVMPSQGYFIRGEVRQAGRYPMITGVTLMQAIATAGGFTEFAQEKKVKLIRGERSTVYNVLEIERNPEKDVLIESGDVIVVDRSAF